MHGDPPTDPLPDDDAGITEEQRLEATANAREVMDRANERNRVLMEARMLPPHAALTQQQIDQIRDHFTSYIEEHGIKQPQVAKEIQYSPPVVSQWLSGTYKGDVSKVTHAINNWMERDARRRQARRPKDYVPTWIAEDIRTRVYIADKQTCMAVIVAPAGTGKTKVLKALAEELSAVYVCCTENMTLRGLYMELAKALGWSAKSAHTYELERYAIERLAGTKRPILIDEAHQLGARIRSLRAIHDAANVPIVFCGTDEIESAADDRAHGRGQFSSRCIYYNALDHAYNAEDPRGGSEGVQGRDLFTVEEIQAYFARRKIRLDRDAFKMMWAMACLPGYGSLRLIERIVEAAVTFFPESEKLSRDELLEALQMIESRRFVLLQRLASRQLERFDEVPAPLTAAG